MRGRVFNSPSATAFARSFNAGGDVKSRRVIREQRGDVHGFSVFIEAGKLHFAA